MYQRWLFCLVKPLTKLVPPDPERWTEAGRCGRSSQHTAEIRVNAPIPPKCFEPVRPSFSTRNCLRQVLGNREIHGRPHPVHLSFVGILQDCSEPAPRQD